jgi:hypothetical protein
VRITRAIGLIASALIAAGCSLVPPLPLDEPEAEWGPLAVVEDAGGMEALTEGIVRIDRECVYVDHGPEKTLLVWDKDRTRWEPPGRILSERFDGEVVVIENGHRFSIGGRRRPVNLRMGQSTASGLPREPLARVRHRAT